MNWSVIILGLVALSSAALAENSYLVIVPKLFKVGYDNQVSVFIAAATQPVEIKFDLQLGQKHLVGKATCKPGETQKATLTLPDEFPVGPGELCITATGGLQFEEKRDVIVYDSHHVILVQTSASTYYPRDTMEVRVVVTNPDLIPMETGEVTVEIYDAALKLVGEFPRIPVRYGLTETIKFPIADYVHVGKWLVSATIQNTTSSVEVLVSRPVSPSFDIKAIFERFLLRTDKYLRGIIEINNDKNKPLFGRCTIAIGQITEQDMELKMQTPPNVETMKTDEWRQWKSQQMEISGRMEINWDLLSLFNVDITKALAVQIYIQVVDMMTGQERVIRHVIPIFTREVIYDIRPLEFQSGVNNEFEIIAKRPDGKPVKMEDMIVNVKMIFPNDQKSVEIKEFYTRGRNDIGFFNLEIPESCIGVLMTITPLDENGKVRGYRTHAVPLMPTPRPHGAKLSIDLLPSTVAPVNTNVNVPVVSSQIASVGRTSNFYVQLMPFKTVEKFERLPMSYVLMTNGRITLAGEFYIEPTKECQTKTTRTIRPEKPTPPTCVFNGTLPIEITHDMLPYSTLIVYTFQPSFGFNVAESYRFSVAGLFQSTFTLNAATVPYTPMEATFYFMNETTVEPIYFSNKVQDKTRVELSFTGTPDSIVGLNVFEYDAVLQGLSTEITKERLLSYLTTYEQVPIMTMPQTMQMPMTPDTDFYSDKRQVKQGGGGKRQVKEGGDKRESAEDSSEQDKRDVKRESFESEHDKRGVKTGGERKKGKRMFSVQEEEQQMYREQKGYKLRYPIEKMVFGVNSLYSLPPVEGDDIYTTSNMGRLYGDYQYPPFSHYRRRYENSLNQYDVTVGNNDYVMTPSLPIALTPDSPYMQMQHEQHVKSSYEMHGKPIPYGTQAWYEKMNTKLNDFSQEAFTFMQCGLTFISDFETLQMPMEMKHENFTKLFAKFRQQSTMMMMMNQKSFDVRDEARQILEEYLFQTDASIMPPPVMFDEQTRTGYYRSVFFNTSRIESQGTGKVTLPRIKPYSTWLASGFALNMKAGLSIAQPIRLPTPQGVYVIANVPKHIQMGERGLLTYGINNYFERDLSNVVFRIRASNDFELMEQTSPERVISMPGKDYTMTIPSVKSYGAETRCLMFVPKRVGIIPIVIEIESEYGGDYEVVMIHVREPGIERKQLTARLYDLTSTKKTYGPMVENIVQTPTLRSVRFGVTGTGVDRLVKPFTMETNSLMGIDRALARLYRSLALRQYLNETYQMESPLYNMTTINITTAYQQLQLYSHYDGSYSFVSDEGTEYSSLYLTSLAFGAMISPMMPFYDNVTLNRTLEWILAHQLDDGSFDDDGPCFHYRYCAGQFRRESLTAIVLYSLTCGNSSVYMPKFIYQRLYNGMNSPIMRAQRYLESRVPDVKSNLLTLTLFEMAFIQNPNLSPSLRGKIQESLLSRKLMIVPEDDSKYLQYTDDTMSFDDKLLLNSMTISLYVYYGEYKTASDMARWVVSQLQTHPYYDTVLDAVFRTQAWFNINCLFRKQFPADKFYVTVDVATDTGEKKQFKIDWKNLDITQMCQFTLPVQKITYSVSGFGFVSVHLIQWYSQQEHELQQKSVPWQLTTDFTPLPWITEVKAKTCMTYSPTTKDQQIIPGTYNRTMVVEVEIPSGMRINTRQIGFFLSQFKSVMYFTYDPCNSKINFFINVPPTDFGKSICFDWCLERLSTIMKWAPIQLRVYDYLQQENQYIRLMPVQFQPTVVGYPFVEAVQKARPTLETLANFHKFKQV